MPQELETVSQCLNDACGELHSKTVCENCGQAVRVSGALNEDEEGEEKYDTVAGGTNDWPSWNLAINAFRMAHNDSRKKALATSDPAVFEQWRLYIISELEKWKLAELMPVEWEMHDAWDDYTEDFVEIEGGEDGEEGEEGTD